MTGVYRPVGQAGTSEISDERPALRRQIYTQRTILPVPLEKHVGFIENPTLVYSLESQKKPINSQQDAILSLD